MKGAGVADMELAPQRAGERQQQVLLATVRIGFLESGHPNNYGFHYGPATAL
jgi:hypothetical protein